MKYLSPAVILLFFGFAGCASVETAYLKHPQTRQVVQCGPYEYVILRGSGEPEAAAARQSQCIEDYKEQGFVRVPGP